MSNEDRFYVDRETYSHEPSTSGALLPHQGQPQDASSRLSVWAAADSSDPSLDPSQQVRIEVASQTAWRSSGGSVYGISVALSVDEARRFITGLEQAIAELDRHDPA